MLKAIFNDLKAEPTHAAILGDIKAWLDRLALKVQAEMDQTAGRPVWQQFDKTIMDSLAEEKLGWCDPKELNKLKRMVQYHATARLGCHAVSADTQVGKYVGFVDLRGGGSRNPISIGLLTPPRYLRHDRDVFVITGHYSYLFGACGFSSTVFSMHDENVSGARCSQACVIMALSTLADRNARVVGSYDITYLGRSSLGPVEMEKLQSHGSDCLAKSPDTEDVFPVTGLRSCGVVKVLKDPLCRATADSWVAPDVPSARRLAKRLLEPYLLARYPVILPVHSKWWWNRPWSGDPGHAVLVIGMRRSNSQTTSGRDAGRKLPDYPFPEITELIIHDPGDRPFVKKPIEHCLDANRALYKKEATPPEASLEMIFATEAKIHRHAHDCVNTLLRTDLEFLEHYHLPDDFASRPSEEQYKFLWTWDYRLALFHKRDLVNLLCIPRFDLESYRAKYPPGYYPAPAEHGYIARLEAETSKMADGWYWCVVTYLRGWMRKLWLFSINSNNGEAPARSIDFPCGGVAGLP